MWRQVIRAGGDPAGQTRRDRIAVAGIADRALEAARQRQAAVRRVRLAPAGHRPRCRHGGGQDAAIGNLSQPARRERGEIGARRGPAAAIEMADTMRRPVVDQPEGVAAETGHVRIEHGKRSARGNRCVHGGATGSQHIDSRLRGQRVRAGDHGARREGDGTACRHLHMGLRCSIQSNATSMCRSVVSQVMMTAGRCQCRERNCARIYRASIGGFDIAVDCVAAD